MIPDEILMARAIKQAAEDNQLTVEAIGRLPSDVLNSFEEYTAALLDNMRYNQLGYFRPFDYQLKFFATGSGDRRGILAANRIGKTVSTCYETACHLTGLYPAWWPESGRKFTRPITAFVAGEGWQQVALVLQNELLGTPDVKITNRLGTGMIPADCIQRDTMRSDGANAISVEIRHVSGQNSTLIFGNYTQEVRQLQGFKLDLAVFDEQPPDDVFSELVTRTATTQGMVLCSFTPLKGLNGLVSKFWNLEDGYEYIRVSWDDVPEYDPWDQPFLLHSTRHQLERDYLPYEREARIKGIPVMGLGAVFAIKHWPTYNDSQVKFSEFSRIERVIALDLGLVNDATVISLMYWDPAERSAWLHRQIVVRGLDEANPTAYIQNLMVPKLIGCPIVVPADGSTPGRYTMSSLSIRELFEEYGLNVDPNPIMNPPDEKGRKTNHKSYGINTMRQMLEAGTLQINENCTEFLRQAQNYFVDEKGRFSDPDDCIDSARYALMACLQGIAEPANHPREVRTRAAKNRILQIIEQRKANKPDWRKPRDPEIG